MINWPDVDYKGFETESADQLPLPDHGPDSFVLQWGVTVKKPGPGRRTPPTTSPGSSRRCSATGFLQDVEIWRNKTRIDNPLLCEEDGPVYQLRRWYEQFYVDIEDVTEEMVEPVRVRGGHHPGQRGLGARRSRRTWPAGRPSGCGLEVSATVDALRVPTSADTLEDRVVYSGLRPVECMAGLPGRVLVNKNSHHHTAIQWCRPAVDQLPGVRPDGADG